MSGRLACSPSTQWHGRRGQGGGDDGEELGEEEEERPPVADKTGTAASIPGTPLRFLA